MNPEELLMGMPFIPQAPINSVNISMGTDTTNPGSAIPAAAGGGGTAAAMNASSGTAVLVAWFLILFILIACNVLTLRIQR